MKSIFKKKIEMVNLKNKYIFTGIVHPARADVNIEKYKCYIKGVFVDINGEMECSCYRSIITIIFYTSSNIGDINEIRNMVRNTISIKVHYLGFILGCGYDVEIDRVVFPNGDVTIFGVDFPALHEYRNNPELKKLNQRNILGGNASPVVSIVLSDFNNALIDPINLPFNCYRCIESIMQFYKSENMESKDAWESMRSKLNIERSDIDMIKDYADSIRHGRIENRTDSDGVKIVTATWDMIFKFFKYLNAHNDGETL